MMRASSDAFATERRGFTLVEMMLAIAVMSILMTVAIRSMSQQITHSRVNRAAEVVRQDLQLAMTEAASRRTPVRVQFNASTMTYTIADRATSTVFQTRRLGSGTEYGLQTGTFSATPVDFYPTGFASGAVTVSLGIGTYSRTVAMTRAGQLRIQ